MNDSERVKRRRNQTLLIVEGYHEKDNLFWLLFKVFPEMNINREDIWIYGTNFYRLYEDIVNEYGDDWVETAVDIDLPFVVSKKQNWSSLHYKTDFTNIILVFDYERQDPYFSEKKILDMQKIFSDMTDMGQLYINYPMLESYLHLKTLPDFDYLGRKISSSLKAGKEYKRLAEEESGVKYVFDFYHKLHDSLEFRLEATADKSCDKCCDEICGISDASDIVNALRKILENSIAPDKLETLLHELPKRIHKAGFAYKGENYWNRVRNIFKEIICHNIWKGNYIQNSQDAIKEGQYKTCYEQLDFVNILQIQNIASYDAEIGFIWVFNTCIFIVAEYNFKLVL